MDGPPPPAAAVHGRSSVPAWQVLALLLLVLLVGYKAVGVPLWAAACRSRWWCGQLQLVLPQQLAGAICAQDTCQAYWAAVIRGVVR